jgi:hypothetical protein
MEGQLWGVPTGTSPPPSAMQSIMKETCKCCLSFPIPLLLTIRFLPKLISKPLHETYSKLKLLVQSLVFGKYQTNSKCHRFLSALTQSIEIRRVGRESPFLGPAIMQALYCTHARTHTHTHTHTHTEFIILSVTLGCESSFHSVHSFHSVTV